MARTRLDQDLITKLMERTGNKEKSIRDLISRRASRHGISSETAQILWAKEFGIGTARYQRSLPPHIQEEVRNLLPTLMGERAARPTPQTQGGSKTSGRSSAREPIGMAIDYLLKDDELRDRCRDLLRARGNFDRVFREATTVLDDRLKRLSGVREKLNPASLVGKAISPNPDTAILRVSDDRDEQEGFHSICKGLVLAFRNPTHHELTNKFSREDALKFCGFIDAILAVLAQAKKNPPSA